MIQRENYKCSLLLWIVHWNVVHLIEVAPSSIQIDATKLGVKRERG